MARFFLVFFCLFSTVAHSALQWSPIMQVPSSSETSSMKVSVNRTSRGLLVWHQKQENRILSSIYHFVEKQWTPPIGIGTQTGAITILASYFNDQSKGGVLWYDAESNSLGLSRYLAGVWSSPFFLNLPFAVENIESIFDAEGNLAIVWVAWNGLEKLIQGIFYSEMVQTWSPISDISTVGFTCSRPKISMNAQGIGLVAWEAHLTKEKESPSQTFIQAVSFHRLHYLWGTPINFGYDWTETLLTHPDVAVDPANNMVLIWEKKSSKQSVHYLQYVRYLAQKNQWSYVSEREEGGSKPQFGKNPNKIQLFWNRNQGPQHGLYLAEVDIENNQWFSIQQLTQSEKHVEHIKSISDPLGKLNFGWLNNRMLQLVHYDKGWIPPISLDKYMQLHSYDFSSDAFGNVLLALLYQGRLMYAIGNYLLPPDYFKGEKVEVRYPSRKINHGYLIWSHAESPNVMGYIIRRNGVIQTILPAHTLQYTDYRCPFDPVNYELSIVNVDNIESHTVKRIL